MKKLTLLTSLLLFSLTSLSGCAKPMSSGQAFAMGAGVPMRDDGSDNASADNAKAPAEKVGPPQVVYRIDKDRYIGMEDYTNCNNGHLYYHNDAKNIKTLIWKMSGGVFNYKGKIAWIATNDQMISVPLVPDTYCSDRGCTSNLLSSPDGGKTFTDIPFERNSLYSVESSKRYLVIVANDAIYLKKEVAKDTYYTIKYEEDETGKFNNSWLRQNNIATNNELVKAGVPREAINDDHPLNFNANLLSNKYHYSDSQLSDVDLKITQISRELANKKPSDNGPNVKSSPAGDSSFHCDVSLIPK